MRSPTTCLLGLLLLTLFQAYAQDPGVREYAERSSQPQSQTASSGSQVQKSAAVLNSMEVLDDTQPIEPGDVISLRIVEDRK